MGKVSKHPVMATVLKTMAAKAMVRDEAEGFS